MGRRRSECTSRTCLLNRRDGWLSSIGTVRAESFSRPKSLYQNGLINDAQESRQESFGTECTPDPTMGEVLQEGNGGPGDGNSNVLSEEEEEELLEKLANRHYYR